jgi:hypothetical protein
VIGLTKTARPLKRHADSVAIARVHTLFAGIRKEIPLSKIPLKVIKDWVGGWTLKRAKEITQDELKAIKALER